MAYDLEHAADHERLRTSNATAAEPTPGRSSRSASLVGPQVPMISGLIQRKGNGGVDGDASNHVAAAGGNGRALPDDLRSRFESSLGTDLSDVRVHTDGASHRAASAVGARAFALGNDVHFASGQYDPNSHAGQHLLAHEVAHTVQQRGGSATRQHKLEVSSASDSFETEADAAADAMVSGAPASVTTAGGMIMRKGEATSDKSEDGDKKAEPKYPSWKDQTINLPIGKFGGLDATYGDKPSIMFSAGGKAKHTMLEKKLSSAVQLAPGLFGSLMGGVELTAEASGKIEGGGQWFVPEGAPPDSEQAAAVSIGGKGSVSLGAKGSLQLSLGAGVANVIGVQGGVEGAIEAKGTASASLVGSMTRMPDGHEKGAMILTIGLAATVEATAAIKVDIVKPGDPINVYECELGKLPLATASVTCVAQNVNGVFTDMPPVTKWELLPITASPPRQKRALTAEEKKKYVHHSEVDEGASGNGPGGETEPDGVEMTDQELLDGGKAEAAKALGTASNAILPFVETGKLNDLHMGTVMIDGVPVNALCSISPQKAKKDLEHGRKVTDVTQCAINDWSVGTVTIDMMKTTAKNTTAVAHAILRNHIQLSVIGAEFNYQQVPIGPCLKDDAPMPSSPSHIPGPDDMPQVKQG